MADVNASGTTAGLDYFHNTVNATWNTAAGVAAGDLTSHNNLVNAGAPPAGLAPAGFIPSDSGFDTPSFPTYDVPNGTLVPMTLQLTGCVQFPDWSYNPNTADSDYIGLQLLAYVNGTLVDVIHENVTAAQYGQYGGSSSGPNGFLNITSPVDHFNAAVNNGQNTMEDILQIASVGRVIYEASEPNDFIGVPEPSTFVMVGLGTLSLLACGWRQRTTKA